MFNLEQSTRTGTRPILQVVAYKQEDSQSLSPIYKLKIFLAKGLVTQNRPISARPKYGVLEPRLILTIIIIPTAFYLGKNQP